jgi:hypothetical protein
MQYDLKSHEESVTELDRTSVAGFHELRARRLHMKSNFYEELARLHLELDANYKKRAGAYLGASLPNELVDVFNHACDVANGLAECVLSSSGLLSDRDKLRARQIYACRLVRGATVRDYLEFDVFHGVLPALDSELDFLLKVPVEREIMSYLGSHVFFHRPQRSAYLFFHELVVAYFISRRFPLSLAETQSPSDFGTTHGAPAVRILQIIADAVSVDISELIALHHASTQQIDELLPQNIRDVFTMSSHLYWYLEVALCYMGDVREDFPVPVETAATVFSKLLHFFTIPCLERIANSPLLEFTRDAGVVTERALNPFVLTKEDEPPAGNANEMCCLVRGLVDRVLVS